MPPLGPTQREAAAKGARMQRVRTDLGFHVRHGFNLESIWIAAGPISAKHDALLEVGQSWEILKALYDTLKTCVLLAMSKDFCVR